MGAGASTTEFKTVEEALAAGKTQEEIDAYAKQERVDKAATRVRERNRRRRERRRQVKQVEDAIDRGEMDFDDWYSECW